MPSLTGNTKSFMITKVDYQIAALAGFLTGIFALPVLINLGVRDYSILFIFPLLTPPLWVFGVWLGRFLSRWLPAMAQFGKFAAVGFLNTAIDFGVLNLLSMATGIVAGFILGGVNIPGFVLAVINGYLWNKYWVFKDSSGSAFEDFPKFFAVSFTAILINSAIVVILTTYVTPLAGVDGDIWLNITKVAASAASLVWNFLGYKFFVFVPSKNLKLV